MTRNALSNGPAVIALGMTCQIGQILFLRELLMVFHGSELSIGIILAAWMAWVGVGSRLGAVCAERANRPVVLLAYAAVCTIVLLPSTLLVIRGLRGFFPVLPGAYLSLQDTLVASFLVMAPVCLLLGAQFVILARIRRESDRAVDTSGAVKTYIGEAAGSIVGGILFTLFLVRHANAFQCAVLVGFLMAAAVLWLAGTLGQDTGLLPRGCRCGLWGALVLSLLAWPFLERLDAGAWRLQWRFFAPGQPLVATYPSKYGNISVVQRDGQYSFFQSNHLVFSAAGAEAYDPALEDQEAALFAHVALAEHRNPARILVIGGGLRGTLREIARHPVERIDYIELDEVLTEAARAFVSRDTIRVLDSPGVRLKHTDGRLFLKTTREVYDMILVDLPDPATAVLNRYYTQEFFREAAARLHGDGVLVIGALSTPDLRGSAVVNRNAAIYHTLRSVFPHVLFAGERFLFFFAGREAGQITSDPDVLQERFLARDIATDAFAPQQFHMLLEEGSLRRINWIVRHHGRSPDAHLRAPESGPLFPGPLAEQQRQEAQGPPVERRAFINSDFRPIGYYYTVVFWNVLTRADAARLLAWIVRVKPWWILPPVGAVLLAAFLLRTAAGRTGRRAGRRFAVLLAVFTTGLSTMSLQIALLFSFQSLYGFVYEMVGLIVALFMAGLLGGAAVVERRVVHKSNLRTLALVQLAIALFAGLVGAALPWAAAVTSPGGVFLLFCALTVVAGLLNGLDFPLATACCLAEDRRPEKATGRVYGTELAGACAGAMLAGTVVAPVLGIVACCLLASLANAASCGALMISGRSNA